jgi:hypothetical protein
MDAHGEFVVLIPVYNDWDSATILLRDLDRQLALHGRRASVILVDDGSSEPVTDELRTLQKTALTDVAILSLRRNLGHQRAIAVGLSYIEAKVDCRAVIVMDGDGEDAPADVPRLLDAFESNGGDRIVFAARLRRSEGLTFRLFYALYRWLHFGLTGIRVRVGNFSVLPFSSVRRLVVMSDLWNHYTAAVHKAGLPYVTVGTKRMPRLAGRSKMNFVSLVIHGLSAMSVFGDRVGVRLLTAAGLLIGTTSVAIAAAVAVRLGTDMAIPGWATTTVGLLLVILFEMLIVSIAFVFIVLSSRENSGFLPTRDFLYYVDVFEVVQPKRMVHSEPSIVAIERSRVDGSPVVEREVARGS